MKNLLLLRLEKSSYRLWFLLLLLILTSCKKTQSKVEPTFIWSILDIPAVTRYEDIFFIDKNTGWTVSGSEGSIYKTSNGGKNWEKQFTTSKYLRSIEFIDHNLGFCGSLNSALYKTTDGGKTWIDISSQFQNLPGICGLTSVNATTIYGCGISYSPAFIIKSLDKGNTWEMIDMSSYASAIIDMYYFTSDEGIVVGRAKDLTEGGIILHTKDGGKSWSVKHKTMVNKDYVWKLQSNDNITFYASIDASFGSGKSRILKSADKGLTWSTITVTNDYWNLQSIGFLDDHYGISGGETMFETFDGGKNWKEKSLGSNYNRFFMIDKNTAFLSGKQIYKVERK